jgi:DNA-dependent ATPase I and helicase II
VGTLKPGFEKEKSKFDKVNNGSEVIEKYREKSSVKNYLEFDDMILWTRKLL